MTLSHIATLASGGCLANRWAILAACLVAFAAPRLAAEPLLPDLIAWANQSGTASRCYMYCGIMDTEIIDNRVLYQFIGALPNIGAGRLEIREVTHVDGAQRTQDVYQRIYDSDGAMTEVLIGTFPDAYSIPPRHLFLPGIAQYNLRMVTAGNGVGPIVASNDKTSMAVVDSAPYDKALPGAPDTAVYRSISAEILGISIGWADVYGKHLPGQWVEATGLPDGQYWLEVIADPYDRIQETDETNNTTRIQVNLVVPEQKIMLGDYNQDDVVDAADYVAWRNSLGQTVPLGAGADGDGNGKIEAADYTVWRANFGNTRAGSGSPASSVPEPSGIVLALIATAAVLRRRKPLAA